MAISDTITSMYENVGNVYDVLELAGADLTNVDKNIENLKQSWEERLLYFLANGTDVVWNNWLPKVTGTGETITLNNTVETKMDIVYKGNTSQKILSNEYTELDYITSDGNSYIDTGKSLGDNFKIETKFIHNQQSSNEQPIMSTWVNSYAWFNLYIASNNQLRFYASGNHMTANPTLTIGNINTVSYSRNDNEWVGTLNGEEVTFNTTITTSNPTIFKIFARGDNVLGSYVSIYRLKLFENNILTMDLIPCYRNSDNVIGMYDIVNNIFYTNSGTGNFTYGSVVPNPDYPQEVEVVTGNNSIKIANNDNTQSQIYPINLGSLELCKIGNCQDYIEKNTGKNLFDNDYANNSSIYTIIIEAENPLGTVNCYELQLKPNTTYTLSINMNGYAKVNSWLAGLCYADGTFISYLQYGTMSEITTKTFITDNTGKIYVGQRYGLSSNDRMPLFLETALIQIEENNRATEYEHYGEKGNWYKYSAIGKIVYNGSESGSWTPSVSGGLTRFASPSISNAQQTASRLQMESNYFHYLSSGSEIGGGFIYSGQFFAYPNQTITTEQNFRDWLSTHNTTVYYVLAKSTYTKITDTTLISQLEAIKKSYNTQTNISQTNADKPFILDVVALGELD